MILEITMNGRMMHIKIISDTHNSHLELDSDELECDMLIHAGDSCIRGKFGEGYNFLTWFAKQPAKWKIYVPGNHDSKCKTHPDLIKFCHETGIRWLKDHTITIAGLKIHGNCRTFWEEGLEDDTHERQEAWENIPEGLDILITHMPPKHILDTNREGTPCGCSMLAKKIKEVKPKYHFFGHIHEHGGESVKVWDTTFINAACMNRDYQMVRGAQELILWEEYNV